MSNNIDISKLSFLDIAALISDEFKKEKISIVLSGGACAQIYSNNKYVTADLDFVEQYVWHKNDSKIEEIMNRFGFSKKGRSYFHPNDEVKISVEFPPGPLEIGEEVPINPIEMDIKGKSLTLLSPTDSLKDRLTWYLHGNELRCLEQAVFIYEMNNVDIDNIREWAKKEGKPERFNEFERRIEVIQKENKIFSKHPEWFNYTFKNTSKAVNVFGLKDDPENAYRIGASEGFYKAWKRDSKTGEFKKISHLKSKDLEAFKKVVESVFTHEITKKIKDPQKGIDL